MPSLIDVYLPYAFGYKDDLTRRGSNESLPLSQIDIGALGSHSNLPTHNPNATVCNLNDLMSLDSSVTEIVFNSAILNDPSFTVLNLTRFENVTSVVIDDESFMYMDELKLIGLNELESVVIGMNSFLSNSGVFTVQRCDSLTELTIGHSSFGGYHEIVLGGVPVLETVSVGDGCFTSSSLELKGENGCVVS